MMEKASWSDIPSLDNLEVDWDYSPENPLGKRAWARLANLDLCRLLDVEYVPVKIVAKAFNQKGYVLDLSPCGLGVLADRAMKEGALVQVGFFLGKHRVTSRGVVANAMPFEDHYRLGIRFIELEKEHAAFIVGITSAKMYSYNRR